MFECTVLFVDIATSDFFSAVDRAWHGIDERIGYTHGKVGRFDINGVMCDLYVWIRCYIRGHLICRICLTLCSSMPIYGSVAIQSRHQEKSWSI